MHLILKTNNMNNPVLLPSLKEDYMLKEEQIKSFRYNGHVLLREVANAEEINAFRPVISEAAYRYNTENKRLQDRDIYGKAFFAIGCIRKKYFSNSDKLKGSMYSLFERCKVKVFEDKFYSSWSMEIQNNKHA